MNARYSISLQQAENAIVECSNTLDHVDPNLLTGRMRLIAKMVRSVAARVRREREQERRLNEARIHRQGS